VPLARDGAEVARRPVLARAAAEEDEVDVAAERAERPDREEEDRRHREERGQETDATAPGDARAGCCARGVGEAESGERQLARGEGLELLGEFGVALVAVVELRHERRQLGVGPRLGILDERRDTRGGA
jgi:hypothetical protein